MSKGLIGLAIVFVVLSIGTFFLLRQSDSNSFEGAEDAFMVSNTDVISQIKISDRKRRGG